jgi:hypothetical protein
MHAAQFDDLVHGLAEFDLAVEVADLAGSRGRPVARALPAIPR